MKKNSLSWKNRILWRTTFHYQNFLLLLEYFLKITSVNQRTARVLFSAPLLHELSTQKYVFHREKKDFQQDSYSQDAPSREKAKLLKRKIITLRSLLKIF